MEKKTSQSQCHRELANGLIVLFLQGEQRHSLRETPDFPVRYAEYRMQTFEQVFDRANLDRAWRRLQTNPDPVYKGYFRSLYSNYAVAMTDLLDDLRDRLRRGVFEAAPSCKLYFPKPAGILRPLTLLTVEDQVVYQAMVNVVADRLFPKVKHRYHSEVFGHLYAGNSSVFFYRKWQKSFARFNRAARTAFEEGFRFAARFDLTAFYDSLDHGVLCHFLRELRCDEDFLELLGKCLNCWTSTQGEIFHNHGIPQGPLCSGLLSEVVLQHFDRKHRAPPTVRYLRYVDDIRLYSRSLGDLRRMVTWLDLLSKEVGLFPQSSKIDIHKVTDIEAELKSVSRPFEEVYDEETDAVDQVLLRRRLAELTPRGSVTDPTEFKFLLGLAQPSAKLNTRLWRVMDNHPEMHSPILTAWVNAMDVFNDWLLFALFKHDPSIGKYNLGTIGSILECKDLKKKYPAIRDLAKAIHEKRGESSLSHPVKRKAGVVLKPTGRIKYGYISTAKRLIRKALTELANKW